MAKSKKIVIIANVTNTHTHRFIREFNHRGWQVHVISVQPPNDKNSKEFSGQIVAIPTYKIYDSLVKWRVFEYSKYHNINSGVRWYEPYSISSVCSYVYLLINIKRIVSRINPDCIFSIYLTMNGVLAARSGIDSIVSSAAGIDVSASNKWSLSYYVNHPILLRYAVRKAKQVIGFDRETFEEALQRKGCITNNVVWMEHWGVDTDQFFPPETIRQQSDECVFICSRPFRKEFDFESILRAFRVVSQETHNVKFIIASGAQSGENKKLLFDLILKTGCGDLAGIKVLDYVAYKDLPALLQKCDAYIDPINVNKFPETRNWGVSGSLLETMACGLVPVISRRPSISWILPPEAKPFIYDDFDKGIIASMRAAIKARNDWGVRMAMRNAVVNKANWSKNFTRIENALLG